MDDNTAMAGEIAIHGEHARWLAASIGFRGWIESVGNDIKIVDIYEEYSFWRERKNLTYGFFHVAYIDEGGERKARFLFYARNSAGVFLVAKDKETGTEYVVLVKQLRLPAGKKLLEIPAGRIEDGEDAMGTAIREIKEEVGLEVDASSVKPLGFHYPSPGLCSEIITLYYCVVPLPMSEIRKMHKRSAGLAQEGEKTEVMVIPLDSFLAFGIADGKSITAYRIYRQL